MNNGFEEPPKIFEILKISRSLKNPRKSYPRPRLENLSKFELSLTSKIKENAFLILKNPQNLRLRSMNYEGRGLMQPP